MPRKKPQIRSDIKVDHAEFGVSIVGVKVGLDEKGVQKALRSELDWFEAKSRSLLVRDPGLAAGVAVGDPVAESLFVCEAGPKATLGFAVNNSGVIVCPNAIGPVEKVTQATSRQSYPVKELALYTELQAFSVGRPNRGLIPSYRYYPEFGESLFTFDRNGGRCPLTLVCVDLAVRIAEDEGIVREMYATRFEPPRDLLGGPVLNAALEVTGVAVAASAGGSLVVQPWFRLENCLAMDWPGALPRG